MKKYDYIVIGSGPGGYVSAIRASQLGLKTAVIEKAEVGGVCLNWGCIPTKSLLESAHFLEKVKNQGLGIEFRNAPTPNLGKIVDRSRKVAGQLSSGIGSLFRKYKVDLHRARAYIHSTKEIHLFDKNKKLTEKIQYDYLCIATGARARELPNLKFSKNVIGYKEAMILKELPASLLVIGAGAIGCEFADFFQCLGSKVTLVETLEHILPAEESFLAAELRKAFEGKKMKILEKTLVKDLNDDGKKVMATIEQGPKKTKQGFDKVLLSVGIETNLEGLGLGNINAEIEKGKLPVNGYAQVQGHEHIFAIGDITQGKQLAHKASHEGILAAEKANSMKKNQKSPEPIDHSSIPSCIYTSPQIASVGYSSQELKKQNIPYLEGIFPLSASGKALALGEPTGLLKSYIHKETGELLGAHYIGHDVTELISNISLARSGELTYHEFLKAIFPHPTLAETAHESVGQAVGESVNY